eukprot:540664_1
MGNLVPAHECPAGFGWWTTHIGASPDTTFATNLVCGDTFSYSLDPTQYAEYHFDLSLFEDVENAQVTYDLCTSDTSTFMHIFDENCNQLTIDGFTSSQNKCNSNGHDFGVTETYNWGSIIKFDKTSSYQCGYDEFGQDPDFLGCSYNGKYGKHVIYIGALWEQPVDVTFTVSCNPHLTFPPTSSPTNSPTLAPIYEPESEVAHLELDCDKLHTLDEYPVIDSQSVDISSNVISNDVYGYLLYKIKYDEG